MDDARFDDLARKMLGISDRRHILRGGLTTLGVAGLGIAVTGEASLAGKRKRRRKRKKRCGKNETRCAKKKCVKGICCPGTLCGGDADCVCGHTVEGATLCTVPAAACLQCESSADCPDGTVCIQEAICGAPITAVCKVLCVA